MTELLELLADLAAWLAEDQLAAMAPDGFTRGPEPRGWDGSLHFPTDPRGNML